MAQKNIHRSVRPRPILFVYQIIHKVYANNILTNFFMIIYLTGLLHIHYDQLKVTSDVLLFSLDNLYCSAWFVIVRFFPLC